jgi:hypothetical protein
MTKKEERVRHWATQPDCSEDLARAMVAQEDAVEQLHRLDNLIHVVDGPHSVQMLERIEEATRKLVDAFAAEAGVTIAK